MKNRILTLAIITFFAHGYSFAQSKSSEGYQPSVTNQPGKEFPQVNSEGKVRAQILAPNATDVRLDIGGVKYEMIKDEDGMWTGESGPQDEGFHYYQLNVDGASLYEKMDVFFLSMGTKEPVPFPGPIGAFKDMLSKQGIGYTFYESPKTAHECLTWRRSLYQYTQLLFKN